MRQRRGDLKAGWVNIDTKFWTPLDAGLGPVSHGTVTCLCGAPGGAKSH